MAGEIPSFFDHIPITQNTINAIKLQELMKREEHRMGTLLVDLQNGWSKDGKKNMEMVRAKLQSLIEESEK
jgi:hypothetical protein